MSPKQKNKRDKANKESGGGVGLFGTLLVGAVAAAAAFLAGYSWHSSPEEETEQYVITRAVKERISRQMRNEGGSVGSAPPESGPPDGTACVCCLVAEREMMFRVCGHVCLCEACVVAYAGGSGATEDVPVVLTCPICRQRSTLRRVYC